MEAEKILFIQKNHKSSLSCVLVWLLDDQRRIWDFLLLRIHKGLHIKLPEYNLKKQNLLSRLLAHFSSVIQDPS